jgi:hypothetical protein
MKVGDIVIAPEGCNKYLTSGKKYQIVEIYDPISDEVYGIGFDIIDDQNNLISCREKRSRHINMQDWILSPTTHKKIQDDKTIIK